MSCESMDRQTLVLVGLDLRSVLMTAPPLGLLAACRTFAVSPLFSTTVLLRVKSYVL